MKADAKRGFGFYWVHFVGALIVAEYVDGLGCGLQIPHWHVPGSAYCFLNRDVCELIEGPLVRR
jgi:hypothetical protein